eukprot:10018566-Lingulodinium_polyedra.AAC.1
MTARFHADARRPRYWWKGAQGRARPEICWQATAGRAGDSVCCGKDRVADARDKFASTIAMASVACSVGRTACLLRGVRAREWWGCAQTLRR